METPKYNPEAEQERQMSAEATELRQRIAELESRNQALEARNQELADENDALEAQVELLDEKAHRDELTGLYNRAGIKRHLREFQLSPREPGEQKPAKGSMLVLDVDNFKIINDAFNHSVGDQVLRAVSQYLNDNTRGNDLVGRWGGEEFVVIFNKTDAEGILRKLYDKRDNEEVGRPRVNVETQIEGKRVVITLSGGVTDFDFSEDPDAVFRRGDAAMYHAKESGKDRVVSYDEIAGEKAKEEIKQEQTA